MATELQINQEPRDLAEYIAKNIYNNQVSVENIRQQIKIIGYYISKLTDEECKKTDEEIWQIILSKNPYLSISIVSKLIVMRFKIDYDSK